MKKLLLATAMTAALFSVEASAAYSLTAIPLTATGQVDFSTAGVGSATVVPANQILYVAGASAVADFLEAAITNFTAPSSTTYKYYTAKNDILTYVFTATTGSTLTAGRTYVVHYRHRDGSMMAPLLAAQKNPNVAPASTKANSSPVLFNDIAGFAKNTAGYTCGAPAASKNPVVTITTCTALTLPETLAAAPATATGTATTSSTLGIADVDATQFASPLNGQNAVNTLAAAAPKMGSTAIAAEVFGVAVTTALRDAMQRAEILSGALPSTCTAGDETEACSPGFTTEQITSIFAQGRFNDWTKLGYASGVNIVTANPGKVPANTAVHICSRTAGSGTLATAQLVFENAPCVKENEAIQAATSKVMAPLNISVFGVEGSAGSAKAYHSNTGSGDVDTCFKALANEAGTTALTPYATGASTADFRWAVGVLNANRNNTGSKGPYRFVKLDGYSPSNVNTANGKYRLWSEVSVITSTPATKLSVTAEAFVKAMSTPANIKLTGVNVTTKAGYETGVMATAVNMTDTVYNPALPVMPFTHANLAKTAGSVNHCRSGAIQAGNALLPGLN